MLSKFSVKKPYTIIVAIVLVIVLGVVSYTHMSVDLIPSINLPYAIVTTTYIGASPEQVEEVITSPLEQILASINNIKNISSVSSENMSMIMLEFNDNVNMDSAVIEIRENLDMVKAYFPDEIGNPNIMKINPDMMPMMIMSVSMDGMSDSESAQYIEDKIMPQIKSVEGVASVSATGLISNMVDVTLSEEKINNFNKKIAEAFKDYAAIPDFKMPNVEITKELVGNILKGQNFSMPAGSIKSEDGYSYLLRVGEKFSSIEELKNLKLLDFPNFESVKLGDIATIREYNNTEDMFSKVNGNYSIMLSLQKQPNYSTADVANSVLEKIDDIVAKDSNISFDTLMNQGEYVNVMINSVISNLLFGALFAIVILFIFLRKIKPTLIVGASIIISVIGAFVLMYFFGITLNMISMGGLALGVGMLVDNSIVVIENIFRLRSEGKSATEAAVEGAKEVAGAITSSTITTIIVFVPIIFTQGITKQLFTDMALTIGFSLIASLIVALTLVPAASAYMLKNPTKDKKNVIDKIISAYTKLLDKSLKHKWVSIVLALVFFGGSIFAALTSGTELFPAMDSGNVTMSVSIPETFTRQDTFESLDNLSEILTSIEGIKTVGIMNMDSESNSSGGIMNIMGTSGTTIYILLNENRALSTNEIMEEIRNKTSDLDISVKINSSNMDMSALSGGKVVIDIYGRELDDIRQTALDISKIVGSVDGIIDIDDGLGKNQSEIRIIVDKEKAIKENLTVAQVYMTVSSAISKEKSVTSLTQDGLDYTIFVKDDRVSEIKVDDLKNIDIESPNGKMVRVSDVAEIVNSEGFSSIKHEGQERYISVNASLKNGYDVKVANTQIENKLKEYSLPNGCKYEISGESKSIKDTFNDLILMLILAILFIYLVMVAQFQSFVSPFIVMFTLPLAFTGGFLALFITGIPISAISLIGFIILVGIVVNNGIVFVDYANQQLERGLSKHEALMLTGKNRFRPVLMTALTTIIALLTMAFDTGSGNELMRPMAITTIGGMIYSTALTLFVIPTLYYIFRKPKNK